MAQIITRGIVLRAINYGEKDKIITLFSREYGRISAILKGVRKLTAKMKFASQPFCYAEFKLVGKKDLYVVAGASEVQSFFDITQNYNKMVIGSAILEMTDQITVFEEQNEILFNALNKALFLLAETDVDAELILMRYALGVFKITGYEMNLRTCRNCGKPLSEDKVAFDTDTGEFNCYKCPVKRYIPVSPRSIELMQQMSKVDFDKLDNFVINDTEGKEFKQIIKANFEIRFGTRLVSLET